MSSKQPVLRRKCESCGEYLVAMKGEITPFYAHPIKPCSGLTDAMSVVVEVDDEALQKIWEKKYPGPKYSDYELLNIIWNSKILTFLIKHYLRLKGR